MDLLTNGPADQPTVGLEFKKGIWTALIQAELLITQRNLPPALLISTRSQALFNRLDKLVIDQID